MKIILKEGFGYLVASGCALVVDVAILWILVQYLSWPYLAAATTSFIAGVAVAYTFSVKLVFKQRRLADRRAEFLSFTALGGVGLAINAAMIFFAVKFLGLHYLIAKCIAAGFTFVCNFVSRRQFLFVQRAQV
jgi:putative flippase GtrA